MSDDKKNRNMEYAARAAIIGTIGGMSAAALYVDKKPKPKGLKAPTPKTEAKVAQRIKADLDKSTTIVDDEGNLRSKTTVNNADKRFRRMGDRLIDAQSKVDAKNLAKQGIKDNFKKLAQLTSKLIYRKITSSHPVAAITAQAFFPSKLGDGTLDGKKYTNYKYTPNK